MFSEQRGCLCLNSAFLVLLGKRHPERQGHWQGSLLGKVECGLDFSPTTPDLAPLCWGQPAWLYSVVRKPCKKAMWLEHSG